MKEYCRNTTPTTTMQDYLGTVIPKPCPRDLEADAKRLDLVYVGTGYHIPTLEIESPYVRILDGAASGGWEGSVSSWHYFLPEGHPLLGDPFPEKFKLVLPGETVESQPIPLKVRIERRNHDGAVTLRVDEYCVATLLLTGELELHGGMERNRCGLPTDEDGCIRVVKS